MIPFSASKQGLRLFGHPAHAVLVHFPLGLWPLVFPLEAAGWAGGWDVCWRLAYWANLAAAAAALPAALAGAIDAAGLDTKPEAAAIANTHMLAMLGAAALFGLDLWLRGGPSPASGPRVFFILGSSLAGTLVLAWGGWLGGELVFRHGIGSDPAKDGKG